MKSILIDNLYFNSVQTIKNRRKNNRILKIVTNINDKINKITDLIKIDSDSLYNENSSEEINKENNEIVNLIEDNQYSNMELNIADIKNAMTDDSIENSNIIFTFVNIQHGNELFNNLRVKNELNYRNEFELML